MKEKCDIFDINIDNVTWNEFFELFINAVEDKSKSKYLLTVNVDHIVKMRNDKEFYKIYQEADIITADGVPVIWASKLLKKPIKQKISGSDILPKIFNLCEEKKYRVFFLGASEGVASKAAEIIKKQHNNINIVGTYSPSYGFEDNEEEQKHIMDLLKEAKPDILCVGLGAPKQEKWIYKHKDEYCVPLSLGIGATFDFIAGNVKRAPLWMQNCGLEWFWRFLQEPKRLFRRYFIEDLSFFYLLIVEYINNRGYNAK